MATAMKAVNDRIGTVGRLTDALRGVPLSGTRGQEMPQPNRDAFVNGLESIQNANFGGFNVNFGPRDHVASKFVDISMITEDGKVRR